MWQASFIRYPANATLQPSFRIAINKPQMRLAQWHNFTAFHPGRGCAPSWVRVIGCITEP
jgi:hypothetical protein